MKTIAISEPTFLKLVELKKKHKKEHKCNITFAQLIDKLINKK